MQGYHIVALFGAFEPSHDLGLFGFKLLHAGDELFWRHALDDDAVNNPFQFAPDLAEPPLQPYTLGGPLFLEPLALGVIGIDKFVITSGWARSGSK